jgi:ABC-type multidrug transport system fused ATPase/permease subunit
MNIISYFKFFQKYLGYRIYIITILAFSASVSEGVGIMSLLPLLRNLTGESEGDTLASERTPFADETLFEIFDSLNSTELLLVSSVAFLLKAAIVYCSLSYNAKVRAFIQLEIKGELYDVFSSFKLEQFNIRSSGDLINILTEQTMRAQQALNNLILFLVSVITVLFFLTSVIVINVQFAIVCASLGCFALLLFKRINRKIRYNAHQISYEISCLNNNFLQTFENYRYLALIGKLSLFDKYIKKSLEKIAKASIVQWKFHAFTSSVKEPVAAILMLLMIYLQVILGNKDISLVIVTALMFYRIITAMIGVQTSLQTLMENSAGLTIIIEELKEPGTKIYQNDKQPAKLNLNSVFDNEIVFDNVHYKFPGQKDSALRGLNFTIQKNSTVAFVGKSGSGKTTIIDLISLIREPSFGAVFIDREASYKINHQAWCRKLGCVTQDSAIFNGTLAWNITLSESYGQPDENEKKKILNALEQAGLRAFVETLEDGIEYNLEERGANLSGGQKQRILIARELYREPEILILDEATSGLDKEASATILNTLRSLAGELTIIIVAHNLSLLADCDKIFVINEGTVAEEGTYQELSRNRLSLFSGLRRSKL